MERRLTALVLSLALTLGCAPTAAPAPASRAPAAPAQASAPAPATSDRLQTLVEAARQEGELTLVWGSSVLGGIDGVTRLAERFNRHYGLNVDVRFTMGASFPEIAAKLIQEQQANRRATTDVYIGSDNSVAGLLRAGALEPADWTAWAPNVRNPALVTGNGEAVTFQTWLTGIAYNTSRVSGDAVPRSMQDLLKPEYKGRIATTPYGANFDRLAAADLWGKERALEYARAYSGQIAGLIRCSEHNRLVNGEFDFFALDCNQYGALSAKARGAPLEFTLAADAPLLSPVYMGVPKTAAHPAAAKLWINYILSREAQDYLYESDYMDSHLVEGSQTAKEIQKLEATGVRFTTVGVEWYQAHDEAELNQVRDEIQRTFRQQ
jgi:iron(III) transport system substrate-binding protein